MMLTQDIVGGVIYVEFSCVANNQRLA